MSTFLSILAFLFAVVVVGVIAVVIVVKRKLRQGVAWAEVKLLDAALQEVKERQAKATAPDQALNDLAGRVESAHSQAKASMEKGDYKAVLAVANPILTELAEYVQKAAEAAQVAQAALPEHTEGEPAATSTTATGDLQSTANQPAPATHPEK